MELSDRFRIEKDSLGEVKVPINALYGVQTVRAKNNFLITKQKTHPIMVKSLGMVKKACALANYECGHISEEKIKYIVQACDEVIEGKWNDNFITDVIQGGAGTSTNMNANEVIANRAAQLAGHKMGVYDFVHPNDDVNFGQSTNDVFPTAGKLTCLFLIDGLIEEVTLLEEALLEKSIEFNDVIKLGRTHLQDAVPIRMGQEFHAFATALVRDIRRLRISFQNLKSVNLGATAVGTGINTDERYKRIAIRNLSEISEIDLKSTKDLIDGTRNVDPFVFAHSALKVFCVNLSKMCNDLRLMASGPKTGLAEIRLPAKQPGSSIMPGKVNPVILEVCNQVCFQVFGNDLTITKAAEAGQLELNVFEPVLFYNLFQSIDLLTNACFTLRVNCISGIMANKEHCLEVMENSLGTATALAPHIGYATASKIAKQALNENKKLKEILIEKGILSKEKLEEILNINEMTRAGIPGMHKRN